MSSLKIPSLESRYYILKGREPVVCSDLRTWGEWFETCERRVVSTLVTPKILVSTVFLGIDHNWWGGHRPILFETMIFGHGGFEWFQRRDSDWREAIGTHVYAVQRVQKALRARFKKRKAQTLHQRDNFGFYNDAKGYRFFWTEVDSIWPHREK